MRSVALAAVLVLVPVHGRAASIPLPLGPPANVPVTYAVNDKALKLAVVGTPLTFELFSDATCSILVHSEVVAIEDVERVSRLDLVVPKHETKPPKTDLISHTLSGVSLGTPLYLKVSSTTAGAIVPAGTACQVQAWTPQPPIGVPLSGNFVRDTNGAYVGSAVNVDANENEVDVLRTVNGTTVEFRAQYDGWLTWFSLGFDGDGCTGSPLVADVADNDPRIVSAGEVFQSTLYYRTPGALRIALIKSWGAIQSTPDLCASNGGTFTPPSSCCEPAAPNSSHQVAPLASMAVDFAPPLHVTVTP